MVNFFFKSLKLIQPFYILNWNIYNIVFTCLLIIFFSLLEIRSSNGYVLHLYGIDINPFNMHEFIVNGDDEYIRMYDKRKLGSEEVKKFRRTPQTVTVNI